MSVEPDPWLDWRVHTPARIALGRAGTSLPTAELLRFGAAHAMARDAVHEALDGAALAATLHADGWDVLALRSRAASRAVYLRRPDLGRRLAESDAARLRERAGAPCELAVVVADGLSAPAAMRHAAPLLRALRGRLPPGRVLAPLVLAQLARVALADEVGEILRARLALILLGERPGLSSPDSLGAYLTFAPHIGCHDAQRNCVSNIRPEGLPVDAAAFRLAWLIEAALRRQLTGVLLKDDSGSPRLDQKNPSAFGE